jgi:hypothetical protein
LIDLAPTMLSVAGLTVPTHMQGQAFLGSQRRDPRRNVYAARDRFDEAYDMVRAVRNRRYKYICNFLPQIPYLLWIPYRNRHPAMQELWRLDGEGKLEGPQKLLMQHHRPVEELYDIEADPHEVNNLAKDPAHRGELDEMRSVLQAWRQRVKDLGDVPETEMVRQWWPDGVQPVTASPIFVPITPTHPGMDTASGKLECRGPLHLQLHCATQGASLTWTSEPGENPQWKLYTGPIRIEAGETVIRAKANRIGYQPSGENRIELSVS